jgi:23S rRNA G2069 N7-methylase RlmK/C1962 C5-methylase RlmI
MLQGGWELFKPMYKHASSPSFFQAFILSHPPPSLPPSPTTAAKGGAKEAIGVDSSALAVETAIENAAANGLESKTSFIKSDVLVYARELGAEGERSFDIVIADPPKLAPTRRDLPRAIHKYLKINRAAFRLVKSGGLVLTHTCSAALTQDPEEFRRMINQAVRLCRL